MPANKAVLRDIHDLGLDPKVAHKSVDSNGRIKQPPQPEKVAKVAKVAKVEKPVKPVADKVPEASTAPATTEVTDTSDEVVSEVAVSNEGAGSVEHKQEEVTVTAPVVKPTVSKPGKRTGA